MQIPKLSSGCEVRSATAQDIWRIRKLVLYALLDPTQLRWTQFWVVEHQQEIIACGQLRHFAEAQELGSLVVASAWRGQGIGSFLTQWLIEQATSSLYIECLGDKLAEFYTPFGFVAVSWSDLPQSLKRKFALSALGQRLQLPVHFMHRPSKGITETS
ncbi:Amino-acid acetyltransferase [Acaryochloris thomasi RCC1774]|uniref:Amino-acid acetyltransferase n=1 Tax=Acaryochloris thomasi RCC1774 TaxID=1764569 RepID=A0A2W1JLV4_9CYAN|nr:GNAT family N-acetyltransferase [Acaryochloris thomasi]PZD74360.1 Amino-acid acetyltransferase [Acaryochloris thomasi RCC1774]